MMPRFSIFRNKSLVYVVLLAAVIAIFVLVYGSERLNFLDSADLTLGQKTTDWKSVLKPSEGAVIGNKIVHDTLHEANSYKFDRRANALLTSDNNNGQSLQQPQPVLAGVPQPNIDSSANALPASNNGRTLQQPQPIVAGVPQSQIDRSDKTLSAGNNGWALQQPQPIGAGIPQPNSDRNANALSASIIGQSLQQPQPVLAGIPQPNIDRNANVLSTNNNAQVLRQSQVKLADAAQPNVETGKVAAPLDAILNMRGRTHNFLDDYLTYPCIRELPWFPSDRWSTDGRCVRTVNCTASSGKIIQTHQCVNVVSDRGVLIPICVYPAAVDKWVSANVIRGNLWERDLIMKMARYIKMEKQKQPDIEFVDLGSNIGCYSLYIAWEGINVTAIDPLHSNMELISKSIILGKIQDRIRLIWNAVANHHNVIKFLPDKDNVGGTRITDINQHENKNETDVARAITLDDLLPLFRGKHIAMKMDIEESEYPALLGGELFFQEVDVKVVQMEFMWHKKGPDGPKIIEYFSKKGFQPYRDLQRSLVLNSKLLSTWPNDVYFMR